MALIFVAITGSSYLAAGAEFQKGQVSLSYIDCRDGQKASEPRVDINDWSGHAIMDQVWPRQSWSPIRTLRFELGAGFYQVSVINGSCHADLVFTVLEGQPRELVAVGRRETVLTNRTAMLSGLLPSGGWRVAIIYPDRTAIRGSCADWTGHLEMPAVVQGKAYYAVALPAGHAIVRLYSQTRDSWFDFDAGNINLSLEGGQSAIIRSINERDLAAAVERP